LSSILGYIFWNLFVSLDFDSSYYMIPSWMLRENNLTVAFQRRTSL
jgi:hypothetical protein